MKKTKKIIAFVGALALIVSAFAGCSDKKEETASEAEVNTLTYWATLDSNCQAAGIANYNDLLLYQELEKRSGIHIDFIHPIQGSTGSEAFLTMLTSKELPDMVEYNWASYNGGSQKAIDDKVIISLDEYLEEYAPNYNDYMNGEKGKANNNLYKLQSTTAEGHHYGFNVLNIGDTRIFSGICIRGDLLEKWGMELPETIDEWTAVFAKAKSEGFNAPFTGINFDISYIGATPSFNNAFNVGKYYYVEDGKVVYAPFQPGFKEYTAQMAEWVKLGYLDEGFVTNDSEKVKGNLTNGVSIAACGNIGGLMGTVNLAMAEKDPSFKLVAAPLPVSEKGGYASYRNMAGEASGLAIAISANCASPETAIGWCDYLYSEEGSILHAFGVEGDTYTVEERDGEKHYVYTEKITVPSKSGVNSISEALYKYMLPANHPGLNQHPDYLEGYYELQEQKDAVIFWNQNLEEAKKHNLPTLEFTEDEARAKTDILEIADTELEVALTDIILGKASIDTYDAAIEKAMENGFDKVLEIYQAAYDRYMEKINK